ncbi:MAG: HAD family hydrolase [Promethearchaeota archaeon]
MKYDAIIFDLFGTLVDNPTFQDYNQLLSQMASVLSLPSKKFSDLWIETAQNRAIGIFKTTEENLRYIHNALQINVNENQLKKVIQFKLDFTRKGLTPKSDAIKTLSELKNRDLKIGLISNCSADVPILWKNTKFAKFIDVAILSCSVGLKKPDPKIYNLACEKLDITPQNCLYIGDGDSHELTGASEVGMDAILIRDPHQKDPYYLDKEEWNGQKISFLKEVFKFL